jgi:hypothetical protein
MSSVTEKATTANWVSLAPKGAAAGSKAQARRLGATSLVRAVEIRTLASALTETYRVRMEYADLCSLICEEEGKRLGAADRTIFEERAMEWIERARKIHLKSGNNALAFPADLDDALILDGRDFLKVLQEWNTALPTRAVPKKSRKPRTPKKIETKLQTIATQSVTELSRPVSPVAAREFHLNSPKKDNPRPPALTDDSSFPVAKSLEQLERYKEAFDAITGNSAVSHVIKNQTHDADMKQNNLPIFMDADDGGLWPLAINSVLDFSFCGGGSQGRILWPKHLGKCKREPVFFGKYDTPAILAITENGKAELCYVRKRVENGEEVLDIDDIRLPNLELKTLTEPSTMYSRGLNFLSITGKYDSCNEIAINFMRQQMWRQSGVGEQCLHIILPDDGEEFRHISSRAKGLPTIIHRASAFSSRKSSGYSIMHYLILRADRVNRAPRPGTQAPAMPHALAPPLGKGAGRTPRPL